ncbi:OmpA family protein [Sphingomonas bacterium]|uniref:OmpA family protein n=1 Tax=Sphingomonas bacterium TaxID=1895847 RepID=UPI001576B162|nr:OmpA family protein [Sphingomonas bacterium]
MRARSPRWAISFADLCLLLLGFMIILQARPDGAALANGLRGALNAKTWRAEQQASALFDGGEAVLNARGRGFVADFARGAGQHRVRLASHGTDPQSARFDGWELSAARMAAVARALQTAHVPADRIALSIDGASGGGQRISLEAK